MLKVPAWFVVGMMMFHAFLVYVFAAVAKMPASQWVTVATVCMGGALASLGVFLGLVKSPITVSVEETTTEVTTTKTTKPEPPPLPEVK